MTVWPLSLALRQSNFGSTLLAAHGLDVLCADDLVYYTQNQTYAHLLHFSIFADLGVYTESLTHLMRRNVNFPNYTLLFNSLYHQSQAWHTYHPQRFPQLTVPPLWQFAWWSCFALIFQKTLTEGSQVPVFLSCLILNSSFVIAIGASCSYDKRISSYFSWELIFVGLAVYIM